MNPYFSLFLKVQLSFLAYLCEHESFTHYIITYTHKH